MNLISEIEEKLTNCIKQIGFDEENVILNISSRPDISEYQYNGAMYLAKKNNTKPLELANKICEEFKKTNLFESISVANPGFINLTISKNEKIKFLNSLLLEKKFVDKLSSKKIIIDYGGPNVAKTLHVGHLRSANIGESLKRLAKQLGYEVISDVHLGDYGLQMGMILLEIKTKYPNLKCFEDNYDGSKLENIPITNKDLIDLYPIASNKAKHDEIIMEQARSITYELQNGNKGYVALWEKIVEISLKDIKKIYEKLNVTFDLWEGESNSAKYFPEMFNYLEEKSYLSDSQGAKVINIKEETDKKEMPPLLLIKSNKALSYESTDLATIWERNKKYNPDEIWYVVDKRQDLHFEQVFRAAKKTNIVDEKTKLEFIGFGTMNGEDGKPFKTRDGGVMSLDDLIEIVKTETDKNVQDNIIGKEREEIVEKIAIGTLKFADLISNRTTDYIFDPIKFSDANGKTAPFVMYSTIRIKSLLKKAREQNIKWLIVNDISNDYENQVVLHILNLQKVLVESLKSKSLNELTNYLYLLNNSYNNLYSNNRILTENDNLKRETWLSLGSLVMYINELLLDIIAIELPHRM